jgi:hypothetical protein
VLSAKRFSLLAIGLIAALITSSSTFTVAHAQQHPRQQMPSRAHAIVNAAIAISLAIGPAEIKTAAAAIIGDHAIAPNITPADIHGLIGTTRDNPTQTSHDNTGGVGLGVLHKFTP